MGEWEKAIACLKELDINPKVDNFQSKLIIQKTIYLLKAMGIDVGYHFNFYVRGTYSPELTDDLYGHQTEFQNLSKAGELTKKEHELVDEFRKVMGQDPDPAVLEIAAAYAFFVKQCGMSARDATIRTKEAKPFFSETQFVQGINRAKELFFHPTEEDLRKLKAEMKAWDMASDEDGRKWA